MAYLWDIRFHPYSDENKNGVLHHLHQHIYTIGKSCDCNGAFHFVCCHRSRAVTISVLKRRNVIDLK